MKALDLHITDRCSLQCPNCSHGIPKLKSKIYDMSIDELFKIQQLIIDPERTRINVSGGEPTCHPKFKEFCDVLRALFPNEHLRMMSNGANAEEYKQTILDTFDSLVFTQYPTGVVLNRAEWPDKVDWKRMNHRDIMTVGSVDANVCPFIQFPMVRNWRIYPCCRVFGLKVQHGEFPEESSLPLACYKDLKCNPEDCNRCWTQDYDKLYKEKF